MSTHNVIKLVAKLRSKTNAPLGLCKKAIEEALQNKGDSISEEELLQDATDIILKASQGKMVTRSGVASEGGVAIAFDDNMGIGICVNTETDFAVNDQNFKDFLELKFKKILH